MYSYGVGEKFDYYYYWYENCLNDYWDKCFDDDCCYDDGDGKYPTLARLNLNANVIDCDVECDDGGDVVVVAVDCRYFHC